VGRGRVAIDRFVDSSIVEGGGVTDILLTLLGF
jgi:hypothetical protein